MAVSVVLGQIALTRIPCGASSIAAHRVRLTIGALEITYPLIPDPERWNASEAVFTIAPPGPIRFAACRMP